MEVLSAEFKAEIKKEVREEVKESFTDFLSQETSEKRWLSIASAAHYADVSFNTIRKWNRMGLNLYVIDGTKRIDKNELDQFIQSYLII